MSNMNIKEEILEDFQQKFCFRVRQNFEYTSNNQPGHNPLIFKHDSCSENVKNFISNSIDKVIQAKNKEFEEKIKSCPISLYNEDSEFDSIEILEMIKDWKKKLLQKLNK